MEPHMSGYGRSHQRTEMPARSRWLKDAQLKLTSGHRQRAASEPFKLLRSSSRSRSFSQPIKTALLNAKRALQSPFGHADAIEEVSDNEADQAPYEAASPTGFVPTGHAPSALASLAVPPFSPRPEGCEDNLRVGSDPSFSSGLFIDPFRQAKRATSTQAVPSAKHAVPQAHRAPYISADLWSPTAKFAELAPDAPARPQRPALVDPDLIPHQMLPVIKSSVPIQLAKKSQHRRRWTSFRSTKSQGSSETADSVLLAYKPFDHPADDTAKSPKLVHTVPKFDHAIGTTYVSFPGISGQAQPEEDSEDLKTPTPSSCEQFDAATPCVSSQSARSLDIGAMTPRMIFDEFERKFQEEELILRRRERQLTHERLVRREGAETSKAITCSAFKSSRKPLVDQQLVALDQSLSKKNPECFPELKNQVEFSSFDDADESETSDAESFDSVLLDNAPMKGRSHSLDVFPLPPSSRRSIAPETTPLGKTISAQRSRILNEDPMLSRFSLSGTATFNQSLVSRRQSAPLAGAVGTAPHGKPPPKNLLTLPLASLSLGSLGKNTSKPNRLPSPYSHFESDLPDGVSPDHLVASTRMMKLFESFIDSPSKSFSPSSTASLRRNASRRTEESPLKKYSETSAHQIQRRSSQPPPESVNSGPQLLEPPRTPSNPIFVRHSSALSAELPKIRESPLFKDTEDDMSFLGLCLSQAGDPPHSQGDEVPSATIADRKPSARVSESPLSSLGEASSPATDDGRGESPRTPFGDLFDRGATHERYVLRLGSMLAEEHLQAQSALIGSASDKAKANGDDLARLGSNALRGTQSRASMAARAQVYSAMPPFMSEKSMSGIPVIGEKPFGFEMAQKLDAMARAAEESKAAAELGWTSGETSKRGVGAAIAQSFAGRHLRRLQSITKLSGVADELLSKGLYGRPGAASDFEKKSGETEISRGDQAVGPGGRAAGVLGGLGWIGLSELQGLQETGLPFFSQGLKKQESSKPISGRVLFEESNPGGTDRDATEGVAKMGKSEVPTSSMSLRQLMGWRRHERAASGSEELENTASDSRTRRLVTGPLIEDWKLTKKDSQRMPLVARPDEHLHGARRSPGTRRTRLFSGQELETVLSPRRLYGKRQGIRETGVWARSDLNIRQLEAAKGGEEAEDMCDPRELTRLRQIAKRKLLRRAARAQATKKSDQEPTGLGIRT